MAFFRKKKEEPADIPMPEFPRLPAENFPEFPSYETTRPKLESINTESSRFPTLPKEEIPKIEPYRTEEPIRIEQLKQAVEPRIIPREQKVIDVSGYMQQRPMQIKQTYPEVQREKKLFVGIEEYENAVQMMNNVRGKLIEAEEILKTLEMIRQKENEEINKWHNDIEKIKESLVMINKRLFG